MSPGNQSPEELPEPARGLQTRFCELVKVRYPIVQTGMGWVAGVHLVAATAAAGALGILASATMTLGELERALGELAGRAEGPFGVNLRADAPDGAARIALAARAGATVVSFAQAPSAALVQRAKEAGLVVMATVGARRHAEKVAEWGVDVVLAQGAEGGGHTGAVPTSLLVPSVVDAVGDRLVVLAAGGFFDGRGLVAALAYGAEGIGMGTRFLLSRDSRVPEAVKAAYLATSVTGTVVSERIDGAPQRVVRTALVDRLERAGWWGNLPRALRSARGFRKEAGMSRSQMLAEARAMKEASELRWSQVIMAANAPMMTKAALVDGRTDVGVLPTGQVVGVLEDLPSVGELVGRIVLEANATLARLTGGGPVGLGGGRLP